MKYGTFTYGQSDIPDTGGMTLTYTPWGESEPVTVTLPLAQFGEEAGYIEGSVDAQRALDGTLNIYRAFNKKHRILSWEYLSAQNMADIKTVWLYGGPFAFADYTDTVNQFTGVFISEPKFKQEYYGVWSGEAEVQEI